MVVINLTMILIKLIFIGYLFYYIIDKLFQLKKKDNHSYKILLHEVMYDNYYNIIKNISPSSNIFTCPIEDKKIFTVICSLVASLIGLECVLFARND